jgi:hypothetical protein
VFDKAQVSSALYGIVGLKQPYNPDYAILDANNVISRSGYFSSDNPFAKVEFIVDCMDYPGASNAQINDFIKTLQTSAITDVCNLVFDEPDFIDRQFIFNNTINKAELENTYNGFCGFEMLMDIEKNVSFEIKRVKLHFSGVGNITLALFNSEIADTPIFTKVVNITSTSQIEELNWYINGSGMDYKGRYYIGYIRENTTVPIPFKRNYYNSVILSAIKFEQIRPCRFVGYDVNNNIVPVTNANMNLGDLRKVQYVFERHGINPDITVFYDYTDLILRNERLLARAIDLAFQIKIINSYLTSTRSNRDQRIASELITKAVAEVEGIKAGDGMINKPGLNYGLSNEVTMLKKQIRKLKDGYEGSHNALNVSTIN